MGFLKDLASDSEQHVLAPDSRVYVIRRIRSADLAEHSVAYLVGATTAAEEMEKLKQEEERSAREWKLEHTAEDEREDAEAKEAEKKAYNERRAMMALVRSMTKNPKMAGDLLKRTDAYVCAGVVGGGDYIGDPANLPPANWPMGVDEPKRDRYVGVVPASDCETVRLRFVIDEAAEDLENDRGWVARIDEETRGWLAGAVESLSGAAKARPFRRGSGSADRD